MKKILTEEHKQKLRLANLGKHHKEGRWTEKARKKHSQFCKGRKLRPWAEEEKLRQSIRISKIWAEEKREKQANLKLGKNWENGQLNKKRNILFYVWGERLL